MELGSISFTASMDAVQEKWVCRKLTQNYRVDGLCGAIHFVSLRIIKEQFLKEAAPLNSKAGKWLEAWRRSVKAAGWKNIGDVRETYPSADSVEVESGRSVTVFNVCGNDYRLLTAIHYDKQRIYTLQFLTHAEYDKNKWKKNL